MSWRKARNAAFLLLAYAVALMPRLYVVRNPGAAVLYRDGATGLYNGDELMVLSAMLDRLLGVPSLGTMWPVVTLQMLSLPLWLVRALGGTHLPHGHAAILARLAQELATAVANPIASLTLMRTVNATTSAVAASLAAAIALRCGASRSFTLLTAAAVAVCPIFFLQSVMASGEGLMLTMELAALALLLPFYMEDEDGRHLGRCLAAGFCFSAAIASKYTAAPAVLLLGGVLLAHLEIILFLCLTRTWTLRKTCVILRRIIMVFRKLLARIRTQILEASITSPSAQRIDPLLHRVTFCHDAVESVCHTAIALSGMQRNSDRLILWLSRCFFSLNVTRDSSRVIAFLKWHCPAPRPAP